MATFWQGSDTCDICGLPCGKVLFDAVHASGRWAVMCKECWMSEAKSPRLGTGIGQRYVKGDSDEPYPGKYLKVEG